jgi:enterochelin esterase-like enzyme
MKTPLALACLILLLPACAGRSPSPGPTADAPTLAATATAVSASTTPADVPPALGPTATAAPSTSPTPSCLAAGGRLESGELSDQRLTRPLAFLVYLPPCYDQDAPQRFPALYMLHGLDKDDHEWVNLGLTASADRLNRAGVIPPFLIVMPWERTGLDMDIAVPQVLVPYIDQHYRTLARAQDRGIGGLSRGGGWALHIGMRRLDQFGVIGLHSPAPFGVDLAMLPRWVERQGQVAPPKVWIDIGDRDPLLPSTEQLIGLLDGMPLTYTFTLGHGWHDADYWSKNVGTYLRWYGAAW